MLLNALLRISFKCYTTSCLNLFSYVNLPAQQMTTSFAAQSNRFPGDMYNNYGSSMLSGETGKVDMSINGRNIDISPSMLSHNPNSGFGRTMNGNIVKAEPSYYAGSSPFKFSQPSSFPESRQQMGDACLANFSNIEPNSQHLLETLLDGDTSSYGFLEPIPPNFDFPGDNFTSNPLLPVSLSVFITCYDHKLCLLFCFYRKRANFFHTYTY